MDYIEFVTKVRKVLADRIPEHEVVLELLKSNNEALLGIKIILGENKALPTITLKPYYKDYIIGRKSIASVANDIYSVHYEKKIFTELLDMDIDYIYDFKSVMNMICFQLIDTSRNLTTIEGLVTMKYYNLSLIFYIELGDSGIAMIDKNLQDNWGVKKADIFKLAALNTPRMYPVLFCNSIQYAMAAFGRKHEVFDLASASDNIDNYDESLYVLSSYVLSGIGANFGAAAMLYPNVLFLYSAKEQKCCLYYAG